MWGQTEAVALLTDVDANRHINDALVLPLMTLVPDLPSAVGATRRENLSERPWIVCEVRKSGLGLGIGIAITLHRLGRLNVKRPPPWCFGPVREEDPLSACAMPTLVFTNYERDDSVSAISMPVELTAERTRDEFR
jgi:hypothetical protein